MIRTAAEEGDLTTLQQLYSSGVDVTGDLVVSMCVVKST